LALFVFESDVEPDDDDKDADYDVAEDDDDDDDDQQSSRASRSTYIGRGNVLSRKLAGLNDAFPMSDKLMVKFADHMQMTGKAANDISNKVT